MIDKKKPSLAKRETLVPPKNKPNKGRKKNKEKIEKKNDSNITSFEAAKKKKEKKKPVKPVEKEEKKTGLQIPKSKIKSRLQNTKETVEKVQDKLLEIEDSLDPEPGKTSRAKQKRQIRKIRRRKIVAITFATILVLFLLGYFLFTIKTVQVEGNKLYEDQIISEMVLSDAHSWNALYVVLKNKFAPKQKMPFIDDVEISLTGIHSIKIVVFEKPTIGCIYVDGSGQYAYFDKDGLVCELSSDVIDNVPQIYGISCFDADLYDEIELSDPSVLKTLLLLVVDLDKYNIPSDSISFQGSHIKLQYGHITVNLGTSQYLTEKLMRLSKVLPELNALAGTLHLDTWTPENTDIVFKKQK